MSAAKTKPQVPGFLPPDDLNHLLIEKLESSGLTLADAKHFGMSATPRAEVARLLPVWGRAGVPALRLNYLDLTGEPMKERLPGDKALRPFARYRHLTDPPKLPDGKEPGKYLQEKGTNPHIYFPRHGKWPVWSADYQQPLLITEGELKAAKAVKEGFPCIGLGGVHSWKIGKDGTLFLDELEAINWSHRDAVLVFDSDIVDKPQVQHALMGLADALVQRGARPRFLELPDVYEDTRKTGLDDFLLERHRCAELPGMIRDMALPLTAARELRVLNSRYTYVEEIRHVVKLGTALTIKPAELPTHDPMIGPERRMKDGKISYFEAPATKVWLAWKQRSAVRRIVYTPTLLPMAIDTHEGERVYNRWEGWGCTPAEGDVTPFLDLIRFIFNDAADHESQMEWFLNWLAYPLQNPGAKLPTAVVLYSICQGNGKSTVGATMKRIYGNNYSLAGDADLAESFNYWAAFKQFIMLDDVSAYTNRKAMREQLKTLVTRETIRVKNKYMPEFEYKDVSNILITTNQPNAIDLEDNDRRFFVHEILEDPLPTEFYTNYYKWLDKGGAAAIFHYLMKRDLKKFTPYAPAPETDAKTAMIAEGKTLLGRWVAQLDKDPDSILICGEIKLDKDLIPVDTLVSLYNDGDGERKEGKDRKNTVEVAQELHRSGFRQVHKGKQIGPDKRRYYAVRNKERWQNATLDDIKDHLEITPIPPSTATVVKLVTPKYTRKATK